MQVNPWMIRALHAVLISVSMWTLGCRSPHASKSHLQAPSSNELSTVWSILELKTFVDLTHSFSPETPVWSGFGPAQFNAAADPTTHRPYSLSNDGFRAQQFTFVGQYGTHIDPPAHFSAEGHTLDRLPLKDMILPLIVFDLTPKLANDPNHSLTVQDILDWEAVHGRVPKGAFAALRTDLYKDWEKDPLRFQRQPFPAWSLEAIQFLYQQRGIKANGHESLDTDTTSDMKSETWLLKEGHWKIEVMAHLDAVPATGALLVVAWPKPKSGLGFPVRAFAILP